MIEKAVVDRIEGDWAIVIPENGGVFNLPITLFPDLKEGNHITIRIEIDRAGEKATMERIAQLRAGLNKTPL
jgi:hypothetical protein